MIILYVHSTFIKCIWVCHIYVYVGTHTKHSSQCVRPWAACIVKYVYDYAYDYDYYYVENYDYVAAAAADDDDDACTHVYVLSYVSYGRYNGT